MMSKYRREIHPADSTIPSAGENHREKYINFLQEEIEERTIDLENPQVTQPKRTKRKRWFRWFSLCCATDENTTEITESGKHTEFTKNWIAKMEEIKKSFENTLEEKKQELETIEENLEVFFIRRWIHIIRTTPPAFRPYKYEKNTWRPSLETIQEQSIGNKAKKTTNKSSLLHFFVSRYSYYYRI
ncbi:uncharacterized protein LOC143793827 isoform X2 [Ranitomeya variabilis]|uniref:uncharacterized protein LOC143793827 isoform X2 n=1 Tax=Ranitomeya variabilis TaxID=490064 RepID=UPI004055FFF4